MKLSPRKINLFLLFKLPAAFLCGVRLKSISDQSCVTRVRYRWINQNPFNSLYFAVQAMASELSTGALVLKKIQESGNKISMLVTHNTGSYSKKAVGTITFNCSGGAMIDQAMQKAIATKEGQKVMLTSVGVDQEGDEVGRFTYEWSIKAK